MVSERFLVFFLKGCAGGTFHLTSEKMVLRLQNWRPKRFHGNDPLGTASVRRFFNIGWCVLSPLAKKWHRWGG